MVWTSLAAIYLGMYGKVHGIIWIYSHNNTSSKQIYALEHCQEEFFSFDSLKIQCV